MRNISWPVLTLIGPVYTKGSEYFANSAAGSLETGMPLLFAPLNWNLGATREKIGAIACIKTWDSKKSTGKEPMKKMYSIKHTFELVVFCHATGKKTYPNNWMCWLHTQSWWRQDNSLQHAFNVRVRSHLRKGANYQIRTIKNQSSSIYWASVYTIPSKPQNLQ